MAGVKEERVSDPVFDVLSFLSRGADTEMCTYTYFTFLPDWSLVRANLEYVRQFAEPGAFGEQQRWRALAGHMVQVQLEPDGAHLGDGRANVLQEETNRHTYVSVQEQN